ncbi:hypothetical protein FOE78_12220 [Microlunatus elymi]|uniref:Uncharacterized protein n=1 Tax=Microlunatus elymi TaxID=2596828 RepID=A0A516PZH6_9ACTN|nr:hypothetical protein [Microlunatus elymi]QDP96570.1 hypothetical protein FOE78_12220 [Microlunatus elymi]
MSGVHSAEFDHAQNMITESFREGMSNIVVANDQPAETPPASGVMVINVRHRGGEDGGLLIRLTSALGDAEPDVTVVTADDDVLTAVASFLRRFEGPKS